MSYQDDYEDLNYDDYAYDDQSEPIDIENNNNIFSTNYEFLVKDEIEKERENKIEEFKEFSSLNSSISTLLIS